MPEWRPPSNSELFATTLWNRALESYGGAVHLTIKLFDPSAELILGPIHSTPLFQLFEETGYDPGLFDECARRCLDRTTEHSAVIVSEFYGLSVIGTPLGLDGVPVAAVVGGYAFIDFSNLSEIQRLARDSRIAFDRLWEVARAQKPVPRYRLILNGELLQVLGDALLRENYRTRQYEQSVLKLEESARENAKAHQALQRTAAALSVMNDDLKQFAYAASHDLQEPLRVVSNYSQLLIQRRGDQFDEEAARWIRFIEESAGRMGALLTDLRAYIQVAQPESEVRDCIDLNRSLDSAVKNLKAAVEESAAKISSDRLPTVKGERVHFVQLFQNLIGNAIKYRGTAAPCVRISVERCGSQWRFAVADNGMGIDPQYHRSIFGVFKRLHGKDIPGTGIGLAICQRIVEHHGGRIWVESQPGAGAMFYFTLPAAELERE